jgi:[acyl-carrier-protein] S-malonyltransferase
MTLAILLSGQGGQHGGMFDLTADRPEAAGVFEAARPLLGGTDPRDLAKAGEGLHGNRTGQILCCVAALAGWSVITAGRPGRAVVAGYSIGDLAAWGVAGRFDAPTVLRLAAARAEAMDAASGEGFGLAGIRGLGLDALETLAHRHRSHLAIRNAAGSGVVGGQREALEALCREAIAQGAQRAVLLDVMTPSHTPLLAEASDRFRALLAEAALHRPPPSAPRLLSGLDGAPVFQPEAGLDKLAQQISRTIDWAACLEACGEYGATHALELGPGHALATMAQGALSGCRVHALDAFRSADGVRDWLSKP